MATFASVDIGSNTLLLLIVEQIGDSLNVLYDACEFGTLSQGLATSSSLHPEAMERCLNILRGFREELDRHPGVQIRCIATQAVREADNRDEFVVPAENILGATIEVIAGEREAQLVARAVTCSLPRGDGEDALVVDVGGASTEFIHLRGHERVSECSLPIGAVRLSEAFLLSDPPSFAEIAKLNESIDESLTALDVPSGIAIIGTAGTSTTIASMHLELEQYEPDRIHALSLSPAQVHSIRDELFQKTISEKKSRKGLAPERAAVIAGGVAIYSRVLETFESPTFEICDHGVRWGRLYEMMAA